ncbi:hypothetical protein evm_006810 [Chilo suppressalis]|nr:hypothetical protein evm_006810 [Chilo suppressalis]
MDKSEPNETRDSSNENRTQDVLDVENADSQGINDNEASSETRPSKQKCSKKTKIEYDNPMGYIVDKDELHTDPVKLEAIRNYPISKSVKNVRSFVGMCSYYRRFVPDFSNLIHPLTKLTSINRGSKVKFYWTANADISFKKLKEVMTSAPVLQCPNFEKPFSIHCDASGVGVVSVLMQDDDDDDGHPHPIAYFSKLLSKREQNYSVTERELLAVLLSIEHFRPYNEGTEFSIVTDHAN